MEVYRTPATSPGPQWIIDICGGLLLGLQVLIPFLQGHMFPCWQFMEEV